jgi:hypothetical protein
VELSAQARLSAVQEQFDMTRKMSVRCFVFLFGGVVTLTGFARASEPDEIAYPLRVQVMHTGWHRTAWRASGAGEADLKEDGQVQGFDYTFVCPAPFSASKGGDSYIARWKNVGSELVILTHPLGNPNKIAECDLKVKVHSYSYRVQNGQLMTATTQPIESPKEEHVLLQQEPNPTTQTLHVAR